MADGLFAGRYELAGLLGSGGMARVHRANDTRMGRPVAVKTLLPELASDPDARRRFAREARAAGALNHPGIVTVHDQDETQGADGAVVPYLVMEYVLGGTLAQLVREQAPFEPERAVRIVCDILDALAHAHSHGTVHRDVKPANVMVTPEGTIKVADFGIARVLDNDARLTTTGSAIGTPSYMSPEQINGLDVDPRSDVYSTACVLMELLTGRPPFIDGNQINLMYWHVHTAPPVPSSRNPRVPRELDALVLAGLSKNPEDRPRDAGAYRDLLRGRLTAARSSALTGPATSPVRDPGRPAPTPAPSVDPRATYGFGPALPAMTPDLAKPPSAPSAPGTPPSFDRGGQGDATPPPSGRPEHPAYSRSPQVPLPPPYLPSTPPPLNINAQAAPAGTGEHPRRNRRRWIAAGSGVAVAAVAVSVTLAFAPHGGGPGPDPTHPPTTVVQNAALALHGGKEGSGYGGGLDGVVRPSTKKGGTLRIVSSYWTDEMLDPAATYDQSSWDLQRLYLRKLVDYAPAPGAAGGKLVPDLATDTGKLSSDGLTWTFHLKKGVTFQDGSPITSEDIKYGIERTFDRTVFPGGPTYFLDLLDQGQHYLGPYKDSDPDGLGLNSVKTPDDSTIEFTLAKPFADFRYVLALSIGAPVPRDSDTAGGKDYQKSPVASGPYKVSSYDPGKSLHLVRNTAWNQSTDPIHSALPDDIDVRFLDSQDAVDDELFSGAADLDLNGSLMSDTSETKLLNDPKLKGNTDLVFSGATRYLSLQTNVAPFNAYQCRRAIQYAVDRTAVRAQFGGQYDGGDIATTMLPPTTDGYTATATPYGRTDGTAFPDAAKKQTAACGHPSGFSTTLVGTSGSPKVLGAMTSIQAALAKAGITVKIETVTSQVLYDTLTKPDQVKAKGWGMVLTSWAADWPTGGGFLRSLVRTDGSNNYSGLSDTVIDNLINKADGQSNPGDAAKTWQQIDQTEMGESTLVPLLYPRHLVYHGSRLTNVYEHVVLGGVDLTALGVSG
jgi:peptide/nickel transport system substrate-binding protein